MCQRYVLPDQSTAEREFLPDTAWWTFAAKFNVTPAQYVPAVRLHEGRTEGVMLRWGLIPSWVEGEPTGAPKINVQAAAIERSKIYRPSWLEGRRCILAMAGFYAWQLTREHYRQPFFARLIERSVFGVAALWDRWVSEEDDVIESCSVIGVPANELMSGIVGAQRGMPAILRRKDYQTWLRGSPSEARSVLRSYATRGMQAYAVSPRINAFDVDDSGLIRAAG